MCHPSALTGSSLSLGPVKSISLTIRQAAILAVVLAGALLTSTSATAQSVFTAGFEGQTVEPLFPLINGEYELPAGPATTEFNWFLEQLQTGANPTSQDILDHFDDVWFDEFTVQQTLDLFDNFRAGFPNATLTDLIGVTPMEVTGLITGDNGHEGFTIVSSRYASSSIHRLQIFDFGFGGGTTVFPADQNLNLSQAADRFATLSDSPGLLIARVNLNNQCEVIEARNPDVLRATASIFKVWVLGAVADAIIDGTLTPAMTVPLDASEFAFGGPVINEPQNTAFTINDYALLMLGISDNTATDMLHGILGRERIGDIITAFGHSSPTTLTPLLGISEQFHLLFSFNFNDANSYVTGTESFQNQFLTNQIEPLGSITNSGFPFNNESLYVNGSWRASPMDVCRAFAQQRLWAQGSDEMQLVDAAMGAQAAQPNVRNEWDRVWYKGGNLESGVNGQLVLTNAWLLENSGEMPFVVVTMANQISGGIDVFDVQSINGRLLELVADMQQ